MKVIVLVFSLSFMISYELKTVRHRRKLEDEVEENAEEVPLDEYENDYEYGENGEGDEEEGRLRVEHNFNKKSQYQKFKLVEKEIELFESEYKECIDTIHDNDYTTEKVEECVGPNYLKVMLDIRYVTMRLMSDDDTQLRNFFITGCYLDSKDDIRYMNGCDLLETDTLDLLWNGLDYGSVAELNSPKYMEDEGRIPKKKFKGIVSGLKNIATLFFELLESIDNKKDNLITALKVHVDERTQKVKAKNKGMSTTSLKQKRKSVKRPGIKRMGRTGGACQQK